MAIRRTEHYIHLKFPHIIGQGGTYQAVNERRLQDKSDIDAKVSFTAFPIPFMNTLKEKLDLLTGQNKNQEAQYHQEIMVTSITNEF